MSAFILDGGSPLRAIFPERGQKNDGNTRAEKKGHDQLEVGVGGRKKSKKIKQTLIPQREREEFFVYSSQTLIIFKLRKACRGFCWNWIFFFLQVSAIFSSPPPRAAVMTMPEMKIKQLQL